MKSTGGNRFIGTDPSIQDLIESVAQQLLELYSYIDSSDRRMDFGEVEVTTTRIPNGNISVTVTADAEKVEPSERRKA